MFSSVSLWKDLLVLNVGEVCTTADVSRMKTVWQQNPKLRELLSLFCLSFSSLLQREGLFLSSCMRMNSTSCWEGKSKWDDENKGRWVRCECWRHSGEQGDYLYWCWHTMVSWLMWGENWLFCGKLSLSWKDICDFKHCEDIIELIFAACRDYEYSSWHYTELLKDFR